MFCSCLVPSQFDLINESEKKMGINIHLDDMILNVRVFSFHATPYSDTNIVVFFVSMLLRRHKKSD